MSETLAGAFLGLCVWFTFQTVLSVFLQGSQSTVDGQTFATQLILALLALVLYLAVRAGVL